MIAKTAIPWEFDLFPRLAPRVSHPVLLGNRDLFKAGERVMVVTAHPDDAEFYLGGTLFKLGLAQADIQLVVCTDGDKGYYPWGDPEHLRQIRRREQTEASQIWHGRQPVFLGFRDGRLADDAEVTTKIQSEIEKFRPEYLLCFDSDYPPRASHRDHRHAGADAFRAAEQSGRVMMVLRFSSRGADHFVDISNMWPTKVALLKVHASQFSANKLPRIEAMVRRSAVADGRVVGVPLAEGMRLTELPRVVASAAGCRCEKK